MNKGAFEAGYLQALVDIACGQDMVDGREIKIAGILDKEKRESLPKTQFAVPRAMAERAGDEVPPGEKGAYPIPDLAHARNALARVSQHGTAEERRAVRTKVYARYPGLKKAFEARHDESPTSKENVLKKEQEHV